MKRKLIALGAAGAAAAALGLAAPTAHAEPTLEVCYDVDVNGEGDTDCIVLPPEDGGDPSVPGLPDAPELPGLPA